MAENSQEIMQRIEPSTQTVQKNANFNGTVPNVCKSSVMMLLHIIIHYIMRCSLTRHCHATILADIPVFH